MRFPRALFPSLWDVELQHWLTAIRTTLPEIILNAEAHGTEALLRRVADRSLDVAFMFEAPQAGGLCASEVTAIRLLMVASRSNLGVQQAVQDSYVLVDWGTAFALAHAQHFPDIPSPVMRTELGRIARDFNFGIAVARPTSPRAWLMLICTMAAYILLSMRRRFRVPSSRYTAKTTNGVP